MKLNLPTLESNAFEAMLTLERQTAKMDLDITLTKLIKIRASQINNCAYCIQMHAEEARKLGETENRIYALSAWKESPLFSGEEKAVLALTEELTLMTNGGLSDETYNNVLNALGEKGLTQCIMQVVTINAWNRIATSTGMRHD